MSSSDKHNSIHGPLWRFCVISAPFALTYLLTLKTLPENVDIMFGNLVQHGQAEDDEAQSVAYKQRVNSTARFWRTRLPDTSGNTAVYRYTV